jgi:hypothetical protein
MFSRAVTSTHRLNFCRLGTRPLPDTISAPQQGRWFFSSTGGLSDFFVNAAAGQTVNLVEGRYSLPPSSYEMVAAVGSNLE